MESNKKCGQQDWTFSLVIVVMVMGIATIRTSETDGFVYDLKEEQPEKTVVGNVRTDSRLDATLSSSVLSKLSFHLLSSPYANYFSIDNRTGLIHTRAPIDRETLCPKMDICDKINLRILVQPIGRLITITVRIIDTNDNSPVFPEAHTDHKVLETASVGTGFVMLPASDPDSPRFGVRQYVLEPNLARFELKVSVKLDGSDDIRLHLRESLDREKEDIYRFKITAYDGGTPPRSGSMNITLIVLDANDNSPVFENGTYEISLPEDTRVHTTILQVRARDPDKGRNGEIRYGFSAQSQTQYGHLFSIDPNTGDIELLGALDYEKGSVISLSVTAHDRGADSVPSHTTVLIKIEDVNDHSPEITVSSLGQSRNANSARVSESASIGMFVAYLSVIDQDSGRNGEVSCSLSDTHFRLVKRSDTDYQIITLAKLDREKTAFYNLAIVCKDHGTKPQITVQNVKVVVEDFNDNAPSFRQKHYTATLVENNYHEAFVLQVNATDRDSGKNARIRYSLPRNVTQFKIDPVTGSIDAQAYLDHETMKVARFPVYARDMGRPSHTSSARVTVFIKDVNDEKPKFTLQKYSFGVGENEPAGIEVGTVSAKDADGPEYNEFSYSLLLSGAAVSTFEIDPNTGKIVTTRSLDREKYSAYYFTAIAKDKGVPPLSGTARITVYVDDKNDNRPKFYYPTENNNSISMSNAVPTGQRVTRVIARDRDIGANGKLTYQITGGNTQGAFDINPTTGEISVSLDLTHIDHEIFGLRILAKDQGMPKLSSQTILNVLVNKSVAYPFIDDQSSGLSEHHLTIVVALACASGVITVFLVVAIICIRKQDWNKKAHRYNCRMEALRFLASERRADGENSPNCNSVREAGRRKKEVSFSLDCLEEGVTEKANHWPSPLHHNSLPVPQACSSLLTACATPCQACVSTVKVTQENHKASVTEDSQAWAPTRKDIEAHQLLDMLKDPVETGSSVSVEGSNTDSGRGPSEEGELINQTHDTTQHSNSGSDVSDATMRVVPLSGHNTSREQRGRAWSRRFDPRSSGCHSFQSGKQGGILKGSTNPLSSGDCLNTTNNGEVPYRDLNPGRGQHVHPVADSPPPDYHSYVREQNYGEQTNPCMFYPLAKQSDVHETFSGYPEGSDTLNSLASSQTCASHDDGGSTTTSGSYIVDPEELCQEIEQLFFRDMVV